MMGGQSQRRIDRIIEEMYHNFIKDVAEKVNQYFIPYIEAKKMKGIVLGGPGYAKKDFMELDELDYRIKKLIFPQLFDVPYQGEAGLRELVMDASELLKKTKYIEVENVLDDIKYNLAKDTGLVVYGIDLIKKAMEMGALESLIIYEDPSLEPLAKEAEQYKVKVFIVNDELPDAEWVKKTFGGAIGKLRYKVF